MTCPGCGAPDDHACYRGCPSVGPTPLLMTRVDHYDWQYRDEFNKVWRLKRSGTPEYPFVIILDEILP